MSAQLLRIITEYKRYAMYPDPIHQIYASLWLVQSILLFLWCIKSKRYLPSHTFANKKDILVNVFDTSLLFHAVFYIVELFTTDMYNRYPGMMAHHIGAIILFLFLYSDKRLYCVIATIPFIIHQIFWILINSPLEFHLLTLYNVTFFSIGILSIHIITKRKIKCSYGLSIMCVAVVCVNGFIFCDSYENAAVCPPRVGVFGHYQTDLKIIMGMVGAASVGAAITLSQ